MLSAESEKRVALAHLETPYAATPSVLRNALSGSELQPPAMYQPIKFPVATLPRLGVGAGERERERACVRFVPDDVRRRGASPSRQCSASPSQPCSIQPPMRLPASRLPSKRSVPLPANWSMRVPGHAPWPPHAPEPSARKRLFLTTWCVSPKT